MRNLIEQSSFIRTLPRFSQIGGEILQALNQAHCYISFSYRDACPNAIVEAMAHGLPVLSISSGGIPEIVGNAGYLIPIDDSNESYFSDHRFGMDFPEIDFTAAAAGLEDILNNISAYQKLVQKRFADELDIQLVAEKYRQVIKQLID